MVLIQNLSYSLYFIYFLIKSFIPIKSEMKIFPDHISSGDPIFNTSQVYSATNERFTVKNMEFITNLLLVQQELQPQQVLLTKQKL